MVFYIEYVLRLLLLFFPVFVTSFKVIVIFMLHRTVRLSRFFGKMHNCYYSKKTFALPLARVSSAFSEMIQCKFPDFLAYECECGNGFYRCEFLLFSLPPINPLALACNEFGYNEQHSLHQTLWQQC